MQYPSVLCLKSLPMIGLANALAADGQDRDRKIYVEGLISLSGYEVKTLLDSGIETLHSNSSLVSDPVVVSNPFGGSAHLLVICKGLKLSMLGIKNLNVTFVCSSLQAMVWV